MIIYLCCSTNKSSTGMTEFYKATRMYGIPSKVYSDKGGKNILVCQYKVTVKASRSRESHSRFICQKPANRKALEEFFVVFLLHSIPYFIFF